MRLTVFWERMRAQFGESYAQSVAKDYVLAGLGGRTAEQALAGGEGAKTGWRAGPAAVRDPERRARAAAPAIGWSPAYPTYRSGLA